MSKIISLVQYDHDNEKLYEDNSELIDWAYISEDLINIISESIDTVIIYEDNNSDEYFEIDCINNIEKNIKLFEDKFLEFLKDNNLKNHENISQSIDLFRTLTNVHYIFCLKNKNFRNNDNVLIKIG
ncbi:hypothetical protein [Aliarcobacter cryaerophilus]|uniref:Uncharacterized protein n=2 Tax=unclassified Arcobacter TaxID=2593671 RepID=A0AA96IAP9_9BACT|nr:hypothetical protein RJG52_00510 [Arcobacter sp. AZ-2023]WPD09050.1 hypothetical protein QUR77_07485 [Arcobacter sp. DSM 115954]WNL13882.1 hypothetical protein RJG51_07535 [Arcobacter sp. AZ-2023]WNL18112.1 hypothetical protein RJG53_05745 [Arcobacter sp. AZ-2023]WNL20247.1 hypothetical protein RJG56_05595 [Arcobacter sp. AZ-2023]